MRYSYQGCYTSAYMWYCPHDYMEQRGAFHRPAYVQRRAVCRSLRGATDVYEGSVNTPMRSTGLYRGRRCMSTSVCGREHSVGRVFHVEGKSILDLALIARLRGVNATKCTAQLCFSRISNNSSVFSVGWRDVIATGRRRLSNEMGMHRSKNLVFVYLLVPVNIGGKFVEFFSIKDEVYESIMQSAREQRLAMNGLFVLM
jgi:hypothetical protein